MPAKPAAELDAPLFDSLVPFKYALDRGVEEAGQFEGKGKTGSEAALFDGDDGLPGYAHLLCEILLGQMARAAMFRQRVLHASRLCT